MNTGRCHDRSGRRRFFAGALIVIGLICSAFAMGHAQQVPEAVSWNAWQFLMGEWIGEGGGTPGQGAGGFTFSLDLQNTILVRRNSAIYPAASGRPAYTHDDLMVIYYEKGIPRAMYFDNERHIVHYTVVFAGDSTSVTFLSDQDASTSRYRLTYTKQGEGKLGIVFDIAAPDKPDAFIHYIEATARKK